jgi:uncharacterized protein
LPGHRLQYWYLVCICLIVLKKIRVILVICILFTSLPGCSVNTDIPLEETVRFESGGVFLEGALNLPGGSGQYPLAVFIHGSGMVTRNDYQEFVDPLIQAGIAVFRYDKRGVGASGGVYNGIGPQNSERMFALLASDAASAIRHFNNDKRIDSDKIILIGGSQAGWIIPEINTMADIWLSVCISGPLVSVGEEIYYSDLAENGLHPQEYADHMLKNFEGVKGYDPISRVEKMKTPSLWLFGGKDVSIPIKRSIHLLDSVKTSQHLPVEMKLYPDADHGLYNTGVGKREDHVELIVQWIRNHR